MAYKLSARNQVTVPAGIRRYLGVSPGDLIEFESLNDGRLVIRRARQNLPVNRFARWAGTGIARRSTETILRSTRGRTALR